jgi:hypothetical protein
MHDRESASGRAPRADSREGVEYRINRTVSNRVDSDLQIVTICFAHDASKRLRGHRWRARV